MQKNEAIKIAASFFKHYPSVNEFHITKDEQVFEKLHDADAHAVTLDKKKPEFITVNRDDKATIEKPVISKEQAEVTKLTGMVNGLTKTLEKASAAKKPEIQTQFDEAQKLLTAAEQALAESTK